MARSSPTHSPALPPTAGLARLANRWRRPDAYQLGGGASYPHTGQPRIGTNCGWGGPPITTGVSTHLRSTSISVPSHRGQYAFIERASQYSILLVQHSPKAGRQGAGRSLVPTLSRIRRPCPLSPVGGVTVRHIEGSRSGQRAERYGMPGCAHNEARRDVKGFVEIVS